ncbi:MAG TPA: hypothetical protein VGZ22_13310 [Isosphaeraceae bacterium]|nr:hypothetical protein [Isosphaeraceae bacterium]
MKYTLAFLLLGAMTTTAGAGGWQHDCEREASRAEVRMARAHGRLGPCELDMWAEQQRQLANRSILNQYQSGLVSQPSLRPRSTVGPFSPRVLNTNLPRQ